METNNKESSTQNLKKRTLGLAGWVKKPFEKVINFEEYASQSLDLNEFSNVPDPAGIQTSKNTIAIDTFSNQRPPHTVHSTPLLDTHLYVISKDLGNSLLTEIMKLKNHLSSSSLPSSKETTPSHTPPHSPSLFRRREETETPNKPKLKQEPEMMKVLNMTDFKKETERSRSKSPKSTIDLKKKMHVTNADINLIGPTSW
jgi:hypothetical protein